MKLKILTMAYTRPDIVERGLDSLYEAGVPPETEHFILDQHYPLPSPAENRAKLETIAEWYGIKILDAGRNLGYHEGQNWALERMGLSDEDVYLNYDPDAKLEQSTTHEHITAIARAFELDPTLACVGLNNPTIDCELRERGYFDEEKGGLVLRFMRQPVIMSVIAWNAGFVRQCGGLREPAPMYGGIEAAMFPVLCAHGRRWAVLKDFFEDISLNRQADPEYNEWKHRHGYLRSFDGTFEDYLRSIGRIK